MADGLLERAYNPDVLSCLANLSNDEVFTPPEVVNQILDMLPQELFENPDTTFLDPACKTGVFLREIAKRLIKGLEKQIPNLDTRLEHIFKKQLFGISITELTSLLSRRSIYCSKWPNGEYSIVNFSSPEGNIKYRRIQHSWKNGSCIYCGANQNIYEREFTLETHAYQFIHLENAEEIFNMKFDVIIGNPPYHLSDGGSGPSASPLYDKFVVQAKKLNPRFLTMIIPSRWFAGGKGLDEFRNDMLNDERISKIVDFPNSADCFAGVDIAGGVNYFLWDREHKGECEVTTIRGNKMTKASRKLNEYDIFIRSNESLSIIEKIINSKFEMLETVAFTRNPFGFPSKARGKSKSSDNEDVILVHSQGKGYVKKEEVLKNIEFIEKYKVYIGKLVPSNGEVGIDPEKGYNAITQPKLLYPNEVITDSYLVLNTFDTEQEALNFAKFMTLKLPRFLMHETYSSMNISKSNFRFGPILDFKKEWTDEELYKLFNLDENEVDFVEHMMRTMVLGGKE